MGGLDTQYRRRRGRGDAFHKTPHNTRSLVLDIVEMQQLQVYTTSFNLTARRESQESSGDFLEENGNPGYDASEWGKRFMLENEAAGTDPTTAAEDN